MIATSHNPASTQLSKPRALLAGLTSAHMVNDFYTMILPPLLPVLAPAFGLNYVQTGILAFCFYILSGVLQPTVGHLADKYAIRKKIMLGGFAVNVLGCVALGLSPTYPLVLASCLLFGLAATSYHPQSTNFITRAFPTTKGRAMGVHGWGGSIGHFIAPLIVTAAISWVGWRVGVILLVIPGVLTILFLGALLDEPSDTQDAGFGKGITQELIIVSVAFALVNMAMRGFLTFLPTFLVEQGSSLARAGLITSLMLFVGIAAQPLGGHLYDKVGGRAILLVCALGTGVSLFAFTLSSGVMLIVWTAVIGCFVFALFPVSLAMGSEIAKDNRVGISVGVIFGMSGTLSAITPIFSGYVADQFGLNFAFKLLVIFAILAAVLALKCPGRRVKEPISGLEAPSV